MTVEEITGLWTNLPFLEVFRKEGEKIGNDIKVLERLEKIKTKLKEQRGKK